MGSRRYPRGLDVALDTTIFLVGVAIFGLSIYQWFQTGRPVDLIDLGGLALIVLMARYPVVLPQRGGDAVIGFEISALVFLTLTRTPWEALVVWCSAQIISQTFGRRSMRNRLFNIGVTAISGGKMMKYAKTAMIPGASRRKMYPIFVPKLAPVCACGSAGRDCCRGSGQDQAEAVVHPPLDERRTQHHRPVGFEARPREWRAL